MARLQRDVAAQALVVLAVPSARLCMLAGAAGCLRCCRIQATWGVVREVLQGVKESGEFWKGPVVSTLLASMSRSVWAVDVDGSAVWRSWMLAGV